MDIVIIEKIASYITIGGAILLCVNHAKYSKWGWVLFLVSNAFWYKFALMGQNEDMAMTQVVLALTSAVGIYRSFFGGKNNKLFSKGELINSFSDKARIASKVSNH